MLLSLIIFLPTVAALVLLFMPKGQQEAMKQFSLVTTVAGVPADRVDGDPAAAGRQPASHWAPARCSTSSAGPGFRAFNIDYLLGIDGISLPLVL